MMICPARSLFLARKSQTFSGFIALQEKYKILNIMKKKDIWVGNINTNFTGRRTDDELRMILP